MGIRIMAWQDKRAKDQFYKSAKWKKIRDEVRIESKMKCQVCGKMVQINARSNLRKNGIVDHIEEIDQNSSEYEKYNKENLQLVCILCHNNKHSAEYINNAILEKNKKSLKKANLGDLWDY